MFLDVLITLANVDPFSKLFHQVIRKKISMYVPERFPPQSQTCC